MPLSYQQQLDTLQLAIQKLESQAVKSMTINGRNVTYQDLSILYAREQFLLSRIARVAKGGSGGGVGVTSIKGTRV